MPNKSALFRSPDLPKKAYNWQLLQENNSSDGCLRAVYRHDSSSCWLSIRYEEFSNIQKIMIFIDGDTVMVEDFIKTQAECLANLISTKFGLNNIPIVIEGYENGSLKKAFEYTKKKA